MPERVTSAFVGAWCPIARMACPGSNNSAAGKKGWCPAWLEVTEYDLAGKAMRRVGECSHQKVPDMLAKLETDLLRASRLSNEARNAAESAPVRMIGELRQMARLGTRR